MRASGRGACYVLLMRGTDERTAKKKSYSAKIYLIMDYRKGCRKCGANDVTGFVDLFGAGDSQPLMSVESSSDLMRFISTY